MPTSTTAVPFVDEVTHPPLTEELVAVAIADIVSTAKAKGTSCEELEVQLLADDNVLDRSTRVWLSQFVTSVWGTIESKFEEEIVN